MAEIEGVEELFDAAIRVADDPEAVSLPEALKQFSRAGKYVNPIDTITGLGSKCDAEMWIVGSADVAK